MLCSTSSRTDHLGSSPRSICQRQPKMDQLTAVRGFSFTYRQQASSATGQCGAEVAVSKASLVLRGLRTPSRETREWVWRRPPVWVIDPIGRRTCCSCSVVGGSV
jgi:hypothetical protein